MMSEFEPALARLYAAGKKRFGGDWIRHLEQRRVRLESAYATLYETDRDPIPYVSLSAQTAYVFAYAPARAEYTRQYLTRHREALGSAIFTKADVEIVSFGGGPASELVGLVRYLEDSSNGEPVEKVSYIIYDKDGAWADVAFDVVKSLQTDIELEMRYEEVDAVNRKKMKDVDLSGTDLVIFSYIMSELAKVGPKDQIVENFRYTLRNLKVGSKILFIDNLHPLFIKYFQACKLVPGLVQKNDDDVRIDCDFPVMKATYKALSEKLLWSPRTELRSVSKLIVRTKK